MPFLLLVLCLTRWFTEAEPQTCTSRLLTNTETMGYHLLCNNYQSATQNRLFKRSLKTNLQLKGSQLLPTNLDESYMRSDDILGDALMTIGRRYFGGCDISVAFDSTFEDSFAVQSLTQTSHLKQIVRIKRADDFMSLLWTSTQCRGYIFLLKDPQPLLTFANHNEEPWDYQGKYVVVGFNVTSLDSFASSKKGNKTEHIVGLDQEYKNEWKVYMNQLYWGEGVVTVNRWRRHGFTSDNEIFPDKTKDLRGANITLITFAFEPHVIIKDDVSRPYGRDIQIADAIADTLNFTLLIRKSPADEYWGFPDADGNWNGMNGAVQRHEGHFGMGYSFLTNNDRRTDAIDFSRFYDVDMSCFLVRVEPPLPRWQSLAIPFQMETWLAFFISFMVMCPVMHLLSKASINRDKSDITSLADSYMYTLGIHLREPQAHLPSRSSMKVWISFLWLYGIILTTVYCCNLTAFLTIDRPRSSIQTIQELHASTMKVVGIGCFFKVSLEGSGNKYLKDLATQKYVKYQDLSGVAEFDKMLVRGQGVFLEARTYQDYLIVKNYTYRGVASMRIMKECYMSNSIGITLQNHLPMTKSINTIIGRLIDHGIMLKWYQNILHSSRKTTSNSTQENEMAESGENKGVPLNIDHMQGIFYIYLIGHGLAAIIGLIEVSCYGR